VAAIRLRSYFYDFNCAHTPSFTLACIVTAHLFVVHY
jgi:hypothetical protein